MTRSKLFYLLLAPLLGLCAASASAAVIPWTADMTADQETHELFGLTGEETGSASGTVDTETLELTWTVQWSDLTGPAVGLHFHRGAPGVAGPIVVDIFTGVPHGATDQVTGGATITEQDLDELLAGLWYLNVHTERNPAGEVRGQVIAEVPLAVPTPAPLTLLAFACLLAGAVRRLA